MKPHISKESTPSDGVQVQGELTPDRSEILSDGARSLLLELERRFGPRRRELLAARVARQKALDEGQRPDFLAETHAVRENDWQVAPTPKDLLDRRVEITGPVTRKMVINALNSGANVFMADFEDSCAPTWENIIDGQVNLRDAVARTIEYTHPKTAKEYRLVDEPAILFVRPRGLHLEENHVQIDGRPVSASLFDFALYLENNHAELARRGTAPYYYLPKLESHLEARWWNEVFVAAQEHLGIPTGTIRATVLIETILAAFEMDEILHELREHSVGLNCGRWDYIFSFIKTFRSSPDFILPDRALVGMDQHFLRSYSELLIQTCHRRGAHAMGGMAAQIPIKDDEKRNDAAIAKVRADKRREATAGHDGTWVAHPGLVAVALEEFDAVLDRPNQLHVLREDVQVTAEDLLQVPEGPITEAGLRQNLRVGVLYVESWLRGVGCVPLFDLMEDAATAEISRTQVWQWIRHGCQLSDGRTLDLALASQILSQELQSVRDLVGEEDFASRPFQAAADLFNKLIAADELDPFLTLSAYDLLIAPTGAAQKPAMTPIDSSEPTFENTPATPDRFAGIQRDFTPEDVAQLSGSVQIRHTLAERGAAKLWQLLNERPLVNALGALTGNQAMQMVKGGLEAIYLSGWQVAADANVAGQMYPDQSLYPANSVPEVVRKINRTLARADQIAHSEGDHSIDYFAPILADAEAGFGGPLNAFELMKAMIEAGAAGVHFEDQLASEKKCGHLGGKVLVPTSQFIRTLNAARLAADVCGVETLLVARTDAHAAALLTSDIDERDHRFLTGERTPEGFFRIEAGLESAIARGIAYADYADIVWCETSKPCIAEARQFAEAIHEVHPNKLLAYNCSPSFNWKANLDDAAIATFQRELGALGYKFQFVTLAGFHALNHGMFSLAKAYKARGMAAYSELQQAEFASEADGYTATRHQREVGTSYFDLVTKAVSGGTSSTTAMEGSTESDQFRDAV